MKNKFKLLVPFWLLFLLVACEEENIEEEPCVVEYETVPSEEYDFRPAPPSFQLTIDFTEQTGELVSDWYKPDEFEIRCVEYKGENPRLAQA